MAYMTNSLGRIQALGAHRDTVHDAPATEHAERIFQTLKTFLGRQVPAICQEAVCLQQTGRANELVRVPPE